MDIEKRIKRLRHTIETLPSPLLRKWLVNYIEQEATDLEIRSLSIALDAEEVAS